MALKILAYGDAGASTGFEKVIRNILTYLSKQDEVEVVQYGLGYRGNPDFEYPYKVYPAEYNGDFFGMEGMEAAVKRHQPDVVFILQDLWNITSYMAYKPVEIPSVCYFPVDTPNLKWGYALSLGAVSQPVTYTRFGAMEAAAGVRDVVDILAEGAGQQGIDMNEKRTWIAMPNPPRPKLHIRLDYLAKYQNPENINVVGHGLEHDKFKPLDKALVRKEFGLSEGAFIVGGIGTNQFRKRQDLLIRMFAAFAAHQPEARLLLYCTGSDERGWDLQQLARYYGVMDKVYFVHEQLDRALTDNEMCQLYNACDVMVNTSGGEGWSLVNVESAACGVPQMVPDWSATREIWKDHGMLIKVKDYRIEPRFLNTAHAQVDVMDGVQSLLALAQDEDLRQAYSRKALACAKAQPTWDQVGHEFHKLVYKANGEASALPESKSLNDLLEARTGAVQSELQGKAIFHG